MLTGFNKQMRHQFVAMQGTCNAICEALQQSKTLQCGIWGGYGN